MEGAAAAGAPAQPSAQVAELLKKANCASCHGENFSKPIDPSYPKIAGQYADYLYVALKAYHTDNNRAGRSQQRDHGRHGQAVYAGRAEAAVATISVRSTAN